MALDKKQSYSTVSRHDAIRYKLGASKEQFRYGQNASARSNFRHCFDTDNRDVILLGPAEKIKSF